MDITQIVVALIGLLGTVITAFLIPLIRSKLNEQQNIVFDSIVRIGVYAAEQLYASTQGEEKKAYVIKLLKEKGYEVKNAEVDAAIEAAVKELKIIIGDK